MTCAPAGTFADFDGPTRGDQPLVDDHGLIGEELFASASNTLHVRERHRRPRAS